MIAALLDIARSLAQIMDDETAQLAQTARLGDHAALGQAKQVLAGQLEAEFVKLDALGPDWPTACQATSRPILPPPLAS